MATADELAKANATIRQLAAENARLTEDLAAALREVDRLRGRLGLRSMVGRSDDA